MYNKLSETQENRFFPRSQQAKPLTQDSKPFAALEKNLSRSIQYIFVFYAKQQKLVKAGGTFEDYQEDSTTLSVGEFLVFCKDFGVYSKEKLKKSQLVEVFKVNSLFRKEMNESQFELALRHLASKLLGDSSVEIYLKMLQEFGFGDLEEVKKRCKGFFQPFFSQKGGRTGLDKIRMPSEKNLPRVSLIKIQKVGSQVGGRVKKEVGNGEGVIAMTKRSGYAKKVNSMVCSWQTLARMNAEQIVEREKISELINESESEDEVLNKHYGSLKGKE